jgi:phage terminase large subunit-like protein
MNNGEMESNAPNSDEDVPVKGIARSNTDIANEIRFKTVSSNRGKWYEPGIDIWFEPQPPQHVTFAHTFILAFTKTLGMLFVMQAPSSSMAA